MCVGGGGGGGTTPVLKVPTSNDYESPKKNQLPSEVCLDHPLTDTYKDKRLVNCLVQYWLVFCKLDCPVQL